MGVHCEFFVRRLMVFSSLSLHSRTTALPFISDEKTKWWRPLMPVKAVFLKKGAKWTTMIDPSSFPTSWAKFTAADSSTTFTMSFKHPTFVLLNLCLRRPKHQSGANFVCPTIIKEISILLFRPVITLHARYCMTNLFLF